MNLVLLNFVWSGVLIGESFISFLVYNTGYHCY